MDNKILTLSLIILLAFGWTINPFLKKKAIGDLSSYQYLIMNSVLNTLFILIVFTFFLLKGTEKYHTFYNIDKIQFFWILAASVITVLTSILLITLIKEHNVSYIIPHIQPLVIILTIITGFFIFKEQIDKFQLLGILFILCGLFTINYGKSFNL